MFPILSSTLNHHDHRLLVVAGVICAVGSLSLFGLLQRSQEFSPARRRHWSVIAAVTGGVGVWATHFIAMLAHHEDIPVAYDGMLTGISVLEVMSAFVVALNIAIRSRKPFRQLVAALIAVCGIATMHFTGMAAISTSAHMHYAVAPIATAFGFGWICLWLAFVMFVNFRGWRQVVPPAILAIAAVCVLHFTAMAATSMQMTEITASTPAGVDRALLITLITVAVVLLISGTAIAMTLDRYMTDLKGFSDATLEGIAIVRSGRIIETNHRLAEMLDLDQGDIVGTTPADLFLTQDEHDLLIEHDIPVEASPLGLQGERTFEIATHSIEYRGRPSMVLAVRDLTERKAAQREIEHLARHDVLTELPNRMLLEERLAHSIERARRDGQHVALLAIDLDRFKAVNDVFGHSAGDEVLRRVARILSECARSTDTVARIGGDEFLILQVGSSQPLGAQSLASRILSEFASQMDVMRDPTGVGASIGVAIFPNDAADGEGLRRQADVALYRAKQTGRGLTCFFDQTMDEEVRERRMLEQDLRQAILRRQIHVAFQPIVDTVTGELSGYEALMRWQHPDRGAIPPEIFVPIAEDTGLIIQLGEWILRTACEAACRWPEHLTLAVNVSPVQFRVSSLAASVLEIVGQTGFDPRRLELEITESVLMKDRDATINILRLLKDHGVRIVMDDFGTGYSSLSNLQAFPFDKLKIDRSFVGSFEDDAAARSIIRAIVGIGESLGLPVVAEGVETEAQHQMVRDVGCPQAQGYLFGRPSRHDHADIRTDVA